MLVFSFPQTLMWGLWKTDKPKQNFFYGQTTSAACSSSTSMLFIQTRA